MVYCLNNKFLYQNFGFIDFILLYKLDICYNHVKINKKRRGLMNILFISPMFPKK